MLAIQENHKTLVWGKVAFVTKFRGHPQHTNVIGQRKLANWMQHPYMLNGCSVEVSAVLYALLRQDSDVVHPQCAACSDVPESFLSSQSHLKLFRVESESIHDLVESETSHKNCRVTSSHWFASSSQ